MRKTFENEIPDTAAYTEYLAVVGALVLAALICAGLFAGGLLS